MSKTICALGFFDGVHLGHAVLLRECRRLAQEHNFQSLVVTFDSHPDALVLGTTPKLINSPEDRKTLLTDRFHMDRVVTLPFDEQMKSMPWEDFLHMLCREHNAAGFVCGDDFRFGHRGAGDPQLLSAWCRDRGLLCAVVPEQTLDGVRVSSTYIRRQLETGDMGTAVRFLGHPHILSGTVVHGKQLGRRLGVPTANLRFPEGLVLPKFGVYACQAWVDGRSYKAVTNIGIRPTVSGSGITVEPWLLDYTGDLYGRRIRLEFHYFLRPEIKFDSLEALKAQIHQDAQAVREVFA